MDKYTERMREAAFEYGIKRLAGDLDMTESRLYKKLDSESNLPMTLNDFFRMNRALKEVSVIQPMLDDLGVVATPVAQGRVSEESIFSLCMDKQSEAGKLCNLIKEVMADGRIDLEEATQLQKQFTALEECIASLRNQLKRMHQADLKAVG